MSRRDLDHFLWTGTVIPALLQRLLYVTELTIEPELEFVQDGCGHLPNCGQSLSVKLRKDLRDLFLAGGLKLILDLES